MAGRRRIATVLLALGITTAGIERSHAQAPGENLTAERMTASLALHTKLLCSGVFVAGRDADELIAQDLQADLYTFHDWTRTGDSAYYTSRHHHELVYFGAVNVFDYVLDRPVAAPPGTLWAYRNTNTLTLGHLIRQAVEARGESYLTFAQRALFDPIGARDMVLEPDPYGNFITTGFVYGSANDWARFGQLHLQDGVWQGKRILPPGWVDFIRTPAPAHQSKGYGGQFWLNAGGRYPHWPRDAYWALGWLGQMVLVIPSRDLVIVRLGHSAKGEFDGYIEEVVARILDATAAIDC